MKFPVTPLVAALSAGLFMSSVAWANGGAAGGNGDSFHNGGLIDQGTRSNHGLAGTTDADADGKDGASIIDQSLVEISGGQITGNVGGTGISGSSSPGSGAGAGGLGGGSVFGGLSSGGAGGSFSSPDSSANGGSGGHVSGNRIRLNDVTLTGAEGGAGGAADEGGAGAGGLGGGSVFGGLSSGGAGGYSHYFSFSSSSSSSAASSSANGGSGGHVSDNRIRLSDVTLTGAEGGAGGAADEGGAGAGGLGGGSVFGGFSVGGAGGYSYHSTSTSPFSSSSAHGGSGGNVNGNRIRLSGVMLTGAEGGAGGSATTQGGSGAGGLGGGSVFGGLSSGGAGGYSYSSSSLSSSPHSSANGGSGGSVSDNRIRLSDVTLTGAEGGAGGAADEGGAGAGGLGGGSVFGGLSSGGAGGYSSSFSSSASSPSFFSSSSSNGGSGGHVSGNRIRLSDVRLIGAEGGAGGSATAPGGSGAGGLGGGSVFGGLSSGGAGGTSISAATSSSSSSLVNGGSGGSLSDNRIRLSDVRLIGAEGGAGGAAKYGGSGAGGLGGGSVFGGISSGGAGGHSSSSSYSSPFSSPSAYGGSGGNVSGNRIHLSNVTLTGAKGGAGGGATKGGSGAGVLGGGSVFGGLSSGGAGGYTYSTSPSSPSANGGSGGNVSGNRIRLSVVTLTGAEGGAGGAANDGGAGAGGLGGGSVFGGVSSGGAGGYSFSYSYSSSSSNGGSGGHVSGNQIRLSGVTLTGAEGGVGSAAANYGGAGAGGLGGGSVFGGLSSGGAGGHSSSYSFSSSSSNGGSGGNVSGNRIRLNDVTLIGAKGAAGGAATTQGGSGAGGLGGGSVFGGISSGGAGGYSSSFSSANGGSGGEVTDNYISLAGESSLTGDIYGGYSRGGAKGNSGVHGEGRFTNHNTVTLVGDALTIGKKDTNGSYESGGSIYGGYSVNGDGSVNSDNNFMSYYQGNTLNLDGYRGSLKGIYHFENFNWILPKDVVNGDTLIRIEGTEAVALDHTKHSIAMKDDGLRLNVGDKVTLIDAVQGTPQLTTPTVEQGHFILYDVTLDVTSDQQLALHIADKKDDTPAEGNGNGDTDNGGNKPAGRINPKAKSFLEGRSAMSAMTNHGADMVSENGIAAAQNSGNGAGLFLASAGGSSRYKTGSHIDVKDITFALGVSKGFALDESSTLTVAAFGEYGDGSYTSYNDFGSLGKVRGHGDSNYAGGGVLLHVEGLGGATSTAINPNTNIKAGGHISAALRAGRTRNTFDSADMVNAEGVSGRYKSRANYFSAMVGAGYVLSLDEQQALDFYGRYTWGRLGSDTVHIGKSALNLDSSNSSRLRVGTRYSYVSSDAFTVYGGLAFEREFKGTASGEAAGLGIDQPSLKGNTGVMELGATLKPWASQQALSVDVGVQAYVGKREGVSGSLKLGYVF